MKEDTHLLGMQSLSTGEYYMLKYWKNVFILEIWFKCDNSLVKSIKLQKTEGLVNKLFIDRNKSFLMSLNYEKELVMYEIEPREKEFLSVYFVQWVNMNWELVINFTMNKNFLFLLCIKDGFYIVKQINIFTEDVKIHLLNSYQNEPLVFLADPSLPWILTSYVSTDRMNLVWLNEQGLEKE